MYSKTLVRTFSALLLTLVSVGAHAGLTFVSDPDSSAAFQTGIAGTDATTIDPLDMNTTTGELDFLDGRSVDFSDNSGAGVPGVYDTNDYAWWPEADNFFVGTDSNAIMLDFTGMNVVGIQFEAAVSYSSANLWFAGTSDDGYEQSSNYGVSSSGGLYSFGMFLDANSSGSCESISQMLVEPPADWGIGNITVYENPNCDPEVVPIPPAIALFLSGIGFLVTYAKRRKSGVTTS